MKKLTTPIFVLLIFASFPHGSAWAETEKCNKLLQGLTGVNPVQIEGKWVTLRDRSLMSGSDRELARDFIVSELRARGLIPEIQRAVLPPLPKRSWLDFEPPPPPVTISNVVVRIDSKVPQLRPEKVIIGAHFDVVNNSGYNWHSDKAQFYYQATPGADDNGSGVVGLFALIDRFLKDPPEIPLEFVFFDAEERSSYGAALGSELYSRTLGPFEGADIRQVIVLDMIGKKPKEAPQRYNLSVANLSPKRVHGLAIYLHALNELKPVIQMERDPNNVIHLADSRHFSVLGIPTLLITDILSLRQLPSHYHNETDQAANIDFDYLLHIIDHVEFLVRGRRGPFP